MLAKCSKTAEVLLHPELEHHDYIAQRVCDYVGRSMLELLLSEQSFSKLLHVSKKLMIVRSFSTPLQLAANHQRGSSVGYQYETATTSNLKN